jgi:hypothetical protein
LRIPIFVFLCVEQNPQSMGDTLYSKDSTFDRGSIIPWMKGLAGIPFMETLSLGMDPVASSLALGVS